MSTDQTEIMTLSETAAYLKLAEKTVLRLVHRRELPSFKVASQWRFRRDVIDEWIMTKIQDMASSDLSKMIQSGKGSVPLGRILQKDLIRLDIKPDVKKEVLRQLIEPLTLKGIVYDEQAFLENLQSGKVAAAGVDVLCETDWMDDVTTHRLVKYAQTHDNLIIAPHIGGCTVESIAGARIFVAQKLADFLSTLVAST